MVEGGLITKDGQYEFNAVLLNNVSYPRYMVTECRGLFSTPDFKEDDIPWEVGHGSVPGVPFYQDRVIELDVTILGSQSSDMEYMFTKLKTAFQIQRADHEFVFKKPAQQMLMCYARPRQFIFPSDFDFASNKKVSGLLQLKANDPLVYDYEWKVEQGTIIGGTATVGINCDSFSTFDDGVGPVIEIHGPCVNPRITNDDDGNRFVLLQHTLTTGHYVTLDLRKRTLVYDDGVTHNEWIDPQTNWWMMRPGMNNLTYSRTGISGDSLCKVSWRDGHASA